METMNELPIVFKDLKKSYGKFQALKGLNARVSEGVTGFVGPNGAGISTTINNLIGLLRPKRWFQIS